MSVLWTFIILKPIGTMYFLKISFEHGTIAFRTANASFVLLSKKISFLWMSVPFVLQRLREKKHIRLTMLWFNFILGLNFIFFCFKVTTIHYHTQKQRKIYMNREHESKWFTCDGDEFSAWWIHQKDFFFSDIGGSEKKQQHKSDPCNNLTEISARFVMAQRSRRDLSETDL